ncbi:Trm112 family protein [Aliidiomarina maris]|uniref:UPF0434 protein B0I24_101158 n=1 Tax=Aliidiomarina maris TaxID=531312 RepID=A0A327X3T5_9GAMM|nr:Trm112 family protein [Aliidiomarina maris]MCL5049293.1 Trm112 family protein [Bacillota bacterium]RAK01535.1 hypothetical protein B0I24_101158 [Aliidiomarina maris]RUO28370.1 hypothetical protein CWE07_00765 [Aliidiomarina maris]
MTINANLLAVLACPSCKGKLVWNQQKTELVCRGERLAYPVSEGIPALLADAARELTAQELEKVDTL